MTGNFATVIPNARAGAVSLLNQWKAARRSRDSLMRSIPSEQKAEPASLGPIDAAIEWLAEQISCYQPQSDEEAAAMLEWCVEDCDGQLVCDQYPRAQRAVIEYLLGKA